MAPQIILLVILCLSNGISLAKHGEPREDNYSFWVTLTSTVITLSLLYWGGFFDVFK
jgi:hypothetical protein